MEVAPPRTREEFLASGIEPAECNICQQPFDAEHMPVQIRECGHHFGRACLEEWLRQSDTKGTCPNCRNTLFENDVEDGEDPIIEQRLSLFYRCRWLLTLAKSDSDGFLAGLWREMRAAYGHGREVYNSGWSRGIRGLVLYLIEGLGLSNEHPDRVVLRNAISLPGHDETILQYIGASYCPVEDLARLIIRLVRYFPATMLPNHMLWRALIIFNTRYNWASMATRLQDIHRPDRVQHPDLFAKIYLLLPLMALDHDHNVGLTSSYNYTHVATMLRDLRTPIFFSDDETEIHGNIENSFCGTAARFYNLSGIGDPKSTSVASKQLKDPRTTSRLINTHVRDLWMSSLTAISDLARALGGDSSEEEYGNEYDPYSLSDDDEDSILEDFPV